MKIAFPTNKGEKIARHASFCKSFVIIDTKTGEKETVDNPLKKEPTTETVKNERSGGRHLGTGRIISALLADAGVDFYVYLEAEANFLRHLQREGIGIYESQEKVIETALEAVASKEENMNELRENTFTGFGRRRGAGRGSGRRAGRGRGRGFGKGAGMGQENGRGYGRRMGRGFGN